MASTTPPDTWTSARRFLSVGEVVWFETTPGAPPRGRSVTTDLSRLELEGLVLADESMAELTEDERSYLTWRRVFSPFVDMAGELSGDLASGGTLTTARLSAFAREWASVEERWLLETRGSSVEAPHGTSMHLLWRGSWQEGDLEHDDPFSASRRVASFPLEHEEPSPHHILDVARGMAVCIQQLARDRWPVEVVARQAAAIGALAVEDLLSFSGRRDQRAIEAVRKQLIEALRRAEMDDLIERFDGTVGSKQGAAEDVAIARRLLATATVWGKVRLHEEGDQDVSRWCRPVAQVHEPMRRIGDVGGASAGRRSVAVVSHPLLLRALFVLSDAWSIEERRAHIRSWDDGRTWHEPPSPDWAPKGKSNRTTMGAEVPVFSLCAHGAGTTGALDGLDLLFPPEFLNLRLLLLGP
jgi:hypothetical protein